MYQNPWDTFKAVSKGKFIAINAHKRSEEINKIRAELKEMETQKTLQKINKSRSWFFEKINKINH